MRALLLLAVLATFASVTSSAEAQWLRSRRSSSCANGQCGLNSSSAAAEEVTESQPAASEAPSVPAAPTTPEAPPAPVADPAPAAAPAAAAPAAPQAEQSRTASVSSSRTRSANAAGGSRFGRRLRSRL